MLAVERCVAAFQSGHDFGCVERLFSEEIRESKHVLRVQNLLNCFHHLDFLQTDKF